MDGIRVRLTILSTIYPNRHVRRVVSRKVSENYLTVLLFGIVLLPDSFIGLYSKQQRRRDETIVSRRRASTPRFRNLMACRRALLPS